MNNAVFKLDAPLEAINGSANGVSGTVEFDAANPGATTGKLIAAESLTVPNGMMKRTHARRSVARRGEVQRDHLRGEVAQELETAGDTTTAGCDRQLHLAWRDEEITVPVKITYLKDKLSQRACRISRATCWSFARPSRSSAPDYGINPGAPTDKVADEIELTLSIAESSPKK